MLISLLKVLTNYRSPSEFHTGRVLPKMAYTGRLLPKGEPSSADDERVKKSKSGISVWKQAQEDLQYVFYSCEEVEETFWFCDILFIF